MPGLSLEFDLWQQGITLVAGVDEAGRGPLAGPVVAAAVVLPSRISGDEPWLQGVNDSKRLSRTHREKALDSIREHALAFAVAQEDPQEIDQLGIGNAGVRAMLAAVTKLSVSPEHLLLDFVYMNGCPLPYQTVVKGDSLSYSIAAASIVAKVTRDRWMRQEDANHPGYSFAQHKGYTTANHLARLRALGPCPIHRRSFGPVREAAQHSPPAPDLAV